MHPPRRQPLPLSIRAFMGGFRRIRAGRARARMRADRRTHRTFAAKQVPRGCHGDRLQLPFLRFGPPPPTYLDRPCSCPQGGRSSQFWAEWRRPGPHSSQSSRYSAQENRLQRHDRFVRKVRGVAHRRHGDGLGRLPHCAPRHANRAAGTPGQAPGRSSPCGTSTQCFRLALPRGLVLQRPGATGGRRPVQLVRAEQLERNRLERIARRHELIDARGRVIADA